MTSAAIIRRRRGSTSLLSLYSVLGIRPELAFDFADERYFTNRVPTTFSDAITHTRAGNATMVDADGVLKWAPHNFMLRSEEFDNAAWGKSNVTVSANAAVAPDGTTTADKVINTGDTGGKLLFQNNVASGQTTVAVYAKAAEFTRLRINELGANRYSANFNLSAETATLTFGANGIAARITSVGSGWYLCEIDHNLTNPSNTIVGYPASAETTVGNPNYDADDVSGIYLWGAHLYRSDLGGMVNNPDTGNSYVPTTTAARYLPRRGHHVWNGSAWVNEGLLHESEARTNFVRNSTMQGAADGVLSGAGSLPTNWNIVGMAASDITVTTGAEYGLDYIDVRYNGTPTSAPALRFEAPAQISAVQGNVFTSSVWLNFVAGSNTNLSTFRLQHIEFNSSSVYVGLTQSVGLNLPTAFERYFFTGTVGQATTASVYPQIALVWTSGAIDITLRIYAPQMELGPTPSSYIPTSGAPVTRAADVLTVPAANLPWPAPVVIGPEIATGAPDTIGSDWTDNGDGSYTCNGAQTVGAEIRWNDGSIVAGRVFKVSGTVSGLVTGNLGVRLGAGTFQTVVADGDFEFILADAGATNVQFREQNGFVGTISNLSAREINPLAVSIQMDGLETFADEGSATQETLFDWRVDANKRITLNFDTDSTKVGTLTLTMVNGSGTDETISTTAELTPGVNDPFNVAIVCTSNEIGIALDGTAETRVSHSIGLPDLSAEDATLGGNGTRAQLRAWAVDLTNAGQESATS